MLNENEVQEVIGKTVYSGEGEKIGRVGQVFLDDHTGGPEFMTVNTGLFGTSESFVPLEGASLNGDDLTVPYSKAHIKDAPRVDLDGNHLDESDEQRLFQHYDRATGNADNSYAAESHRADEHSVTGGEVSRDHDTSRGHDTSGPDTDEAMTRSEERLHVGTSTQEAGRARLRKYVTTETETVTVPVRKERAVLETEPITGSNIDEATSGPGISEEEHEVVLNEDRVVVEKVTEPVERVRLGTETVTEQETVNEEVRKEHIEAEGDIDDRR